MRNFFVRRRNPTCEETLGVCAPMAATGVLNHDPWAASIDTNHWVRVKKMVKRAELLFESFAGSEVLDHIQRAKGVVPFKRMHAPHCNQSHAKYFGAIAFGCNVFLRCHDDDDFTLSMAHVILGGNKQYNLDDDVVIYFCFPTLAVAVPMRPGDFLLFNSRIPHCISSRCHHADKIMCISMFLKTAVVGGNSNGTVLTDTQAMLSDQYQTLFS